MSTQTALTVPTRFVEGDGIRFAYRRWGKSGGTPLVFLNYFTGNLDHWDPLVTDGFAADYDVVVFNNAGVASSSGQTPDRVSEMARHAMLFLNALDLKQVNLFGFSLGGMIAQEMSLEHPDRINRMLLVGTGPKGGEGMEFAELSAEEQTDAVQFFLAAFFTPHEASQSAGRAYLKRMASRTHDRDVVVSSKTAEAQLRAIRQWGTVPPSNRYATLKNIQHRLHCGVRERWITVQPLLHSLNIARSICPEHLHDLEFKLGQQIGWPFSFRHKSS